MGSSSSTLPWLPRVSVWALPTPGVLPGVSQAIQKGWACVASPWESLDLQVCEEWIRKEAEELSSFRGSLELAPSARLPLSRDRISHLGLSRPQLYSDGVLGRRLVVPGRLPLRRAAAPPVLPTPTQPRYSRPHTLLGFHTRAQLGDGQVRGPRGPRSPRAGARATLGCPRVWPWPPRARGLRRGGCAPSASREHKQGEEAGVSAWARCQRAGAGTQCPERAGERGARTA